MIPIRLVAYVLGFVFGLALSSCGQTVKLDQIVRVENRIGSVSSIGTGAIVDADGDIALVLTCRHLLSDGLGALTASRYDGRSWSGTLLAADQTADLAAIVIRDPGGVTPLVLADRQPNTITTAGHGEQARTGVYQLVTTDGSYYYATPSRPGHSGSPAFAPDGRLAGIVWGDSPQIGCAVVGLDHVRCFLASPTVAGRIKRRTP